MAVKALRCASREALLEAAHHLEVPVEGQVGVQAADDVELGDVVATLVARRGA